MELVEVQSTEVSEKPKRGPKKKVVTQSFAKRTIDLDSAKAISLFKEKVNKKPFGRDIRDHEILAFAITLLKPEHVSELQERSYSEQDRLNMAHESYMKENGKISLDQFIGKLIRGEITSGSKA